MKKKWQGYIFSGPINGSIIPQRVQNLVVRTYTQRNDNIFILSATEYNLINSVLILRSVIEDFGKIDGILFYSLHMLPKRESERNKLYNEALKESVEIHFCLEDMSIKEKSDLREIEDLILAIEVSRKTKLFQC